MSITDQHAGTRAAQRSTVVGRDHRVPLLGGRATARYRRCGRWAITSTGVHAGSEDQELALSGYLDVLRTGRLRPLFTDVTDRVPFARRGLDTYRYAEEAVLEPARFDLATADHGRLARDVLVARRRLVVLPRNDDAGAGETWTAVDAHGAVQGTATWVGSGTDGTRTLAASVVEPHAPAGTAELLIADAVAEYSDRGATRLGLGRRSAPWWPGGRRVVTGELSVVVARFEPQWQPRWFALYSLWLLPVAAVVLRVGSVV